MALTWYAPDDIAALARAAGYTDIAIGPSPRPAGDGTTFSLVAHA